MSESGAHKVYGDTAKFRRALRQKQGTAKDLLGRIEGVRATYAGVVFSAQGGLAGAFETMQYASALRDLEEAVDRWRIGVTRVLLRYLADAAPRLQHHPGEAPALGRDSHVRGQLLSDVFDPRAERCAQRVNEGQELIRDVLDQLPLPPAPAPSAAHFSELRDSRLVDVDLVDALATQMEKVRTAAQIRAAIGAAKEVVEAANKAACDRLGLDYPGDFPSLTKAVRTALGKLEDPKQSAKAGSATIRIRQGMSTAEQGLAALRNEGGSGHGTPSLSPGLRPRHAVLAADLAAAHTRFLVLSLRDAGLL